MGSATHVKSTGPCCTDVSTRRVSKKRNPRNVPVVPPSSREPSQELPLAISWPRGTRSPRLGKPRGNRLSGPPRKNRRQRTLLRRPPGHLNLSQPPSKAPRPQATGSKPRVGG